jgi:predicted RNase H-like HicB family nuclease
MADVRTYDLHIVIHPAEDVPGQWVSHCLEFDVISQGNDARHALEMVSEAIELTVLDDLAIGRDPRDRRAPQEDWDEMWGRLQSLHGRPLREAQQGETPYLVIESTLRIAKVTGAERAPTPTFTTPVAFIPDARAAR